jgi:hypothetical protein
VGQLLLFHHEPSRNDEAIDEIVATFHRAKVTVRGAAEEMIIDLPH